VRELPISALKISALNPRRGDDLTNLAELQASILQHGILTPLLVRPCAVPGKSSITHEVVAGQRRLRAAEAAGLVTVPVVVHDLTDDQAREASIVENLQRENLRPLEEAAGFRSLLDFAKGRHTPASVAATLGKDARYVWDRLKLLDLVPDAKHLLEDGRLPLPHAILLAKLTPDQQKKAIDPTERQGLFEGEDSLFDVREAGRKPGKWDDVKPVSVREFQNYIATHVRFNVAHAAAAAPLDFGPTAERVEAAKAQPGRGKKVISITHDTYVQPSAKDAEGERTFCASSWKRADGQEKSKPCEHAVLGVVVVGPGYGEAFQVCVHKDCDVHWKAERLAREKQQARSGKPGGTARSEDSWEKKRRERQAKEDAERKAWDALKPAIVPALIKGIAARKVTALADVVLLRLREFCDGNNTYHAAGEQFGARTADAALRHAAFLVLIDQMEEWNAPQSFPKLAKQYGVDVAAIRKAQKRSSPAAAGTCTSCGCTEDEACAGGCAWTDETQTLCTACAGMTTAAPPAKKTKKAKTTTKTRSEAA
jgi:ParB family chromosome partitioning protein